MWCVKDFPKTVDLLYPFLSNRPFKEVCRSTCMLLQTVSPSMFARSLAGRIAFWSVGLPIVRPRHNTIDQPSIIIISSISTFVFRYLPPDEINRPKTSMTGEGQTSQSPPAKCQAAAPSLSLSSDTCSSASIQDRACALFRDAEILAPMVRASTTPLRTLALSYGADLVYTQEIVDRSITTCDRVVNEELGTIDYVRKTGGVSAKALKRLKAKGEIPVVLRIAPELERGRLIYQLGTGESNLALPAALQVQQDVDGLDVNMVRWAYKPSFVSYSRS